jgi:PPM family protein phosphatase
MPPGDGARNGGMTKNRGVALPVCSRRVILSPHKEDGVALFDWYAISEQGPSPEANEDGVIAEPGCGVFLVADGMGGRPGGAQACRLASRTFMECLRRARPVWRMDEAVLQGAVVAANEAVRAVGESESGMAGMGTTLTALVLDEGRGKIAHVGDSRAYGFMHGRLEQLTDDHTLVKEMTSRAEARRLAGRGDLRHVLSRAIGAQPTVEPDIIDLVLHPGEWLLLATDGLHNVVLPRAMASLIAAHEADGARNVCQAIMDAAGQVGLEDNATLVVIRPLGADGAGRRTATERKR